MTNVKKLKAYIAVFTISTIAILCLICSPLFDIARIDQMGNDFQYTLVSVSTTISGFLFTGASILISALSDKRIERLTQNKYLDNSYRAVFTGIAVNIVACILALAVLLLAIEDSYRKMFIRAEVFCILIGLIFFIWCVIELCFVVSVLKNSGDYHPTKSNGN